MGYKARMKAEATERREAAEKTDDPGQKRWLLSRAAFFDRCAAELDDDEQELDLGDDPLGDWHGRNE